MYTRKLNPWNWFNKEDDLALRMPVRGGRPHIGLIPVEPFTREIDRLFNTLLGMERMPARKDGQQAESAFLRPSLDVSGNEKQYSITVELPGVNEKDLRVELDKDVLRIYGEKKHEHEEKEESAESGKGYYRMERSYGSFQRVLTLPDDVDATGISASHKDGVLTIILPRKEATLQESRAISISKAE